MTTLKPVNKYPIAHNLEIVDDLHDAKGKHDAGENLLAQRELGACNEWQWNEHDPDVDEGDDNSPSPEDTICADAVAFFVFSVPHMPESVNWRAAEDDGEIEGQAACDDDGECGLDEAIDYVNLAKDALIE